MKIIKTQEPMKDQNYNNYKRYYIPHHFIFYPIAIALISIGIYQSTVDESLRWVWLFLSVLTALLAWFSFMTRQHYGMTVQNRIILLEMRYRYFVITGERFELIAVTHFKQNNPVLHCHSVML